MTIRPNQANKHSPKNIEPILTPSAVDKPKASDTLTHC